ncbi:hypothetical protein F0562_008048 [Nyssa sinensis]|uniref:Uncharacterized protein n=1 Tax=Nyssa sinensis TaxID=561372 RepID=A0A5J5A5S4_9ASTE|nr:hypothetical protein F0562_008048 [Nyssa sinensis]
MDESENHKIDDTQKVEEFISDDGIVIERVTDENTESVNETLDGDESTPDQMSTNVLISEELEDVQVVSDSVIEPEPSIDSANPVVLAQVAQYPIENSGASDVIEVESKEIVEKIMVLSDENNGVSAVVEDAKVNGGELVLDESNGVSHAVMDLVSEGIDSLSAENEVSPIVTNSVSKGIKETMSLDENNGVSSVVMVSVSKGIEETMLPASDGTAGESPGAVDSVSKENIANMLQPADVPSVDAGNGGEDCNMPELPRSTENQPFIAVIPSPLQRTSWIGCCGLFEVLKRSNRQS